eukprot:2833097-Karenia_brevis.AAC.1
MEPFCQLFRACIDQKQIGHTGLCADDIGVVLKTWHDLSALFRVFSKARSAACLALKPVKCFLVPLSRAF